MFANYFENELDIPSFDNCDPDLNEIVDQIDF